MKNSPWTTLNFNPTTLKNMKKNMSLHKPKLLGDSSAENDAFSMCTGMIFLCFYMK